VIKAAMVTQFKNGKLKQCKQTEFGCFDGHCIPFNERCDGSQDCADKSDEKFCDLVIFDKDIYQKELPPVARNETRANVSVNVEVTDIGTIDEIQMTVEINFLLQLVW
jgi:Low-density lipoprotein receptor domain class A